MVFWFVFACSKTPQGKVAPSAPGAETFQPRSFSEEERAFDQSASLGLYGGETASEDLARYVVRLRVRYQDQSFATCSGGFLKFKDQPHKVHQLVTAAHCIDEAEAVEVSFPSVQGKLSSHCEVDPTSIVMHSGFSLDHYYYDLATMRLTPYCEVPKHIKPLPLLDSFNETAEYHATGYGIQEEGGASVSQLASFSIAPEELVLSSWIKDLLYRPPEKDLLIFEKTPVKKTCSGDSGSPLIVKQNFDYGIVGLTTGGTEKCGKTFLGKEESFFLNLMLFKDWLKEKTGKEVVVLRKRPQKPERQECF